MIWKDPDFPDGLGHGDPVQLGDVDDNEKAYYFQQAQNGLYAREAILCDVLGITLDEVKADTNK